MPPHIGYNEAMERIVDKSIILLCCVSTLFFVPYSIGVVVGILCAITISALQEIAFLHAAIRKALLFFYLIIALVIPGFIPFLPLITYDCFRLRPVVLKMSWLVPLLLSIGEYSFSPSALVVILALVACILSWRTIRLEDERQNYKELHDELREFSLALELKNRDLLEKQDYEVNLATLTERGRIAREIHDNVGHLLTRSVLQIEALQVVHAEDEQIKGELEQVGITIHEAFDTVRESVHNLHDDSFDLHTQLCSLVDQSDSLKVALVYQAQAIPAKVGYCFIAIAREALANSAKHSDALSMKVSVLEYPAFWQLIIHDDGSKNPFRTGESPFHSRRSSDVGGDADILIERGSGIGLKTMEERTRSLGGLFRIDYDKGLRVFVSVPKEQKEG